MGHQQVVDDGVAGVGADLIDDHSREALGVVVELDRKRAERARERMRRTEQAAVAAPGGIAVGLEDLDREVDLVRVGYHLDRGGRSGLRQPGRAVPVRQIEPRRVGAPNHQRAGRHAADGSGEVIAHLQEHQPDRVGPLRFSPRQREADLGARRLARIDPHGTFPSVGRVEPIGDQAYPELELPCTRRWPDHHLATAHARLGPRPEPDQDLEGLVRRDIRRRVDARPGAHRRAFIPPGRRQPLARSASGCATWRGGQGHEFSEALVVDAVDLEGCLGLPVVQDHRDRDPVDVNDTFF
jgi:hypothetical protein